MTRPRQQNTLARREQEYIQLKRRALLWDAVIWLLSSSQNALTIDTALRSIFSLKYVPRKMTSVLSTKVPELLYSKLSLDIPSEDLYSMKDIIPTIQMRNILGQNLDLMMSYLHLWKCMSLDDVDSLYRLSLMTGGLPQVPKKLYPELMAAWKALRSECRSLSEVSARQWPIESLAVAVATEAIYFSLYKTADKAASQMGIVSRANHPLREIEYILEWHLRSVLPNSTYLHQDVLVLLLDSLAHALYPFNSAILRRDAMPTLDLLQRLLCTLGPHHFPVFLPLYACFIMYVGTPEERHRALEQRVNRKPETQLMLGPGHGYLQLVDSVARLFVVIPHSDQATSFLTQTSRSLYIFTYSIGTSESFTETPLLNLPGTHTNDIVRAIHTVHVEEGREKRIHRPIWIFHLLSELYRKPEVSLESRKHIHEILCTLVCRPWPEEKSAIMIPGILNFIQSQLRLSMQDDNQQTMVKDLCKVFIAALVYSLNDDPSREALRYVVVHRWFEVLSSAQQSLRNYEIDNDLTDFLETWNRDLEQHSYVEAEYDAYDYLKSCCPRVNAE
ncbi:hypothetical protein CPB85DRAFT_450604 [Mucidula mucida]|nr:hypothetical protein CPB85DRAFT_450604 [Mucidula mucida]